MSPLEQNYSSAAWTLITALVSEETDLITPRLSDLKIVSCDGGGAEEANQHDWGHLAGAEVLLKPSCPESHGLRDSLKARCRKTLAGILSPRPSSHILGVVLELPQ
ncbi:hypothetical protein NQZ68_031296 [Dissostichus eleginoides]|nr:hypothetical protein NQZ68_004890 [Dissostichus eleginoides]KAI9546007.1 hypothetical protein NQZ68_031296 [Dissostichus eleginoides]